MRKDIKTNVLQSSATLREVMERLNAGVFGIVFIVDQQQTVKGVFTDGDIRRAILAGVTLESVATESMNKKFVYADSSLSHAEKVGLLNERVRHVPVLDDMGRLVDFLSWAEMMRLPLMEPSLGGNELKYVSDCITTGWISSQGEYVRRFEKQFSDFLGNASQCVAVSSGTAALHLALKAIDIGPGDEVIVPDLTFAATANVVLHCGAKVVCADVDPITWTLDPSKLANLITAHTKAIIPVHLYGQPCDMDPILEIGAKNNIYIIEDCAEAQGATYKGRQVGTLGDLGCFSFFSNKVITTGEGGMVSTTNNDLSDKVKILRDHGMKPGKRYWHDIAGFNYRMTNLQAAVGVAQMERVDKFLLRRKEIGQRYISKLSQIKGLTVPPNVEWAETVYWIFSLLIDEEITGINRNRLAEKLSDLGIENRPFFYPMHVQPPYQQSGDFEVSKRLSNQGISLPSGNEISNEEIDRVCHAIQSVIND